MQHPVASPIDSSIDRVANWQYLQSVIALLRQAIESRVRYIQQGASPPTNQEALVFPTLSPVLAIYHLCRVFQLSSFACNLLLLALAVELDACILNLCSTAQADSQRKFLSFNLALAVLPPPHYWGDLTPEGPLRRWQLLELGTGPTLMHSPIRLDERIFHYLIGEPCWDASLSGILQELPVPTHLVDSHQQIADRLTRFWQGNVSRLPIVQLYGSTLTDKQAIAATACAAAGYKLYQVAVGMLPTTLTELHLLVLRWQREAMLSPVALLLDCDALTLVDNHREFAISRFLSHLYSPIIVTSRERESALFTGLPSGQHPILSLEVQRPTRLEQRSLWESVLEPLEANLNGQVNAIVSQFNLSAPTIATIGAEAVAAQTTVPPLDLWQLCRDQARLQMDDLAQRIEVTADWETLVLPDVQRQTLQSIVTQIQQRVQVYEDWGFGKTSNRGLGISALFAGASGTGKTMAAEVLAKALRLDLYRIDLSAVVSKYIGETEKNLRRIFDAAESGSAILLFDEADALFGKRSEVKDSHDRYANLEVSYLLQRMETYQGLAILTTNLKESIDTAFLRRIRFIVRFPFPEIDDRKKIWAHIFPQDTPTDGLEPNKLAKLNVAGGNIRNIALNAAFLAASQKAPVQMKHVREAAECEYAKLERTLTEAEVKGWC